MGSTNGFFARRVSRLGSNFFLLAQVSMFAAVAIVALTVSQFGNASVFATVLSTSGALVAFTAVAFLIPTAAFPRSAMIFVGVFDLAIVAVLRVQLIEQQPRVSILVLIPVLWLAYESGVVGVLLAIVGNYLVAILPYVLFGTWPRTAAQWGNEALFPAIIALVAIAVFFAARRLQRQSSRLVVSDGKLQVSIEQLLDADASALAVMQSVDTGMLFYAPDGRILLANDVGRKLRRLGGGTSNTIMSPTPLVFGADRVTPVVAADQAGARAPPAASSLSDGCPGSAPAPSSAPLPSPPGTCGELRANSSGRSSPCTM